MKDIITKFAAKAIQAPTKPQGQTAGTSNLDDLIVKVINWVMGIIGFVCVATIIISGIQYMTSGGDPGKVKKAKDGLLYSIIGLVVVILAAAIVNFVIKGVLESK